MHGNSHRPKIVFSGGGSGVVSHAGSRLLAELADRAGRHAGHRSPGTTPSRGAAHVLRRRRLAVPDLRHRHRSRPARPPRGPAPRPRPRRGPDPLRQEHRAGPPALRQLNVNTVWVELVGLACDLLAWTRLLLLDGALATAEPKQLRYRLLHVAARLVRSGRRLQLRIDRNWPWKDALVNAFTRLIALPQPAH